MYYLLFAFYLIACCIILTKIKFIKGSGLSLPTIVVLFLIKVMAGLLLGWVFDKYYSLGNDYWELNAYGVEEYRLMISDPWLFATNLFTSHYAEVGGFFSSVGSFWNDLENNIIVKVLAVFNIFSRGNYYINSLLFNFFGFFGHVALYRIFASLYPRARSAAVAGCFLLPSAIFFTSGINKDNAVFTLLCSFCYLVFFTLKNGLDLKKIVLATIAFTGILLMRNYVALAILPGLLAWIISSKFGIKKRVSFPATFLVLVLTLSLAAFLSPSLNPAAVIANKQQDFLKLGLARSQIEIDSLHPSLPGLIKNAPQALNHGFLRPYLWETKSFFTVSQAVELTLYLGTFLFFIGMACLHKMKPHAHPFLSFSIVSACLILLLIGYIVPNTNTIVRYRSIYLPFLITPLLCTMQTLRIKRDIRFKSMF